jgi:hypothetical protein
MTLNEMFESATEEYLKFDRIPESERRHVRPDICAFIYLHEKVGGNGPIILSASHDEIQLDSHDDESLAKLTMNDVVYLRRCGVRKGDYGLMMFL